MAAAAAQAQDTIVSLEQRCAELERALHGTEEAVAAANARCAELEERALAEESQRGVESADAEEKLAAQWQARMAELESQWQARAAELEARCASLDAELQATLDASEETRAELEAEVAGLQQSLAQWQAQAAASEAEWQGRAAAAEAGWQARLSEAEAQTQARVAELEAVAASSEALLTQREEELAEWQRQQQAGYEEAVRAAAEQLHDQNGVGAAAELSLLLTQRLADSDRSLVELQGRCEELEQRCSQWQGEAGRLRVELEEHQSASRAARASNDGQTARELQDLKRQVWSLWCGVYDVLLMNSLLTREVA